LAPLALIGVTAAVAVVVLGSGVTGDDGRDDAGANNLPAATERTETSERPRRRTPARYTIKVNDTLTGIAERTGTTVERLQELNPELDSQGLVVGQRIKLRE
jgi:LysM repeat protein